MMSFACLHNESIDGLKYKPRDKVLFFDCLSCGKKVVEVW